MPRLREHALSGDRPRRGVCSPTATLAKQLETSWLRSSSRSCNKPPPRESPGPQRCQSEPPARPPRSTQKRQRRRGRRPAPPGRGGPRGRVGARGAGRTRRGSRAQVAGAGPAWRLRAGALEPAVTAPHGAATHRLAPRPPPRRRSSIQPRVPRSPIYRLGARGRAGGSRRPRRPRPPPGSGRRRCPPARAASLSQPLRSRLRRRGALLLASRVRRTPGSARARARGAPPPPPRTRPGPAPRPWPRRQVLPPEGPAAGSLRVALAGRASAAVCARRAGTDQEPHWHKGDTGVLEPAPAPPHTPGSEVDLAGVWVFSQRPTPRVWLTPDLRRATSSVQSAGARARS